MTRLRKRLTKEILTEQLNQVLLNKDQDNVPLSRSSDVKLSKAEETERKQRKRKKESGEMSVKKKTKLEWRQEDCAKPIGKFINLTGDGEKKKCHYEKFQFHGTQYGLEDTVLLVPEDADGKPYVAIIKDIYIQGKDGYVKLEVHWFYRPEDVEKKHVGNWESKDSRDLFYSFHRDEVFAESVKHSCVVHFVPENKQTPNRREHPGFIVQNVYNAFKKKLQNFTDDDFNEHQKHEIDLLVAKTISRVGYLPDIKKDHKTLNSRRKRSVPIRFIEKAERTSSESSTVANPSDIKPILEKFDLLTGDSDRDKILEKLLGAVKKDGRYDFVWPNDVVPLVRVLEQVAYDSFGKDISQYNHKMEILVDKLKESRVLARRLLDGELKPEQVIKMTRYELTKGFTFDDMMADVEETTLKIDAPSTSKSVS